MGFPIIGIIDTIAGIFKNWQEKKKVEAEGKVRIAQARVDGEINLQQKIASGEVEYNVEAQKGMAASWKDELFVVVWLAILIGCFLPWTKEYVKDGFLFLKVNTPWWFEYSLLGMVIASFGLKGWKMWKQNGNGQ